MVNRSAHHSIKWLTGRNGMSLSEPVSKMGTPSIECNNTDRRVMRGQRSLDAFLTKKPLNKGGAADDGDSDTDFQETPHRLRAALKAAAKAAAKPKAKAKAKASPQAKATKRRRATRAPALAAARPAGRAHSSTLPLAQEVVDLTSVLFDKFRRITGGASGAAAAAAGGETIVISDSKGDSSE